MRKVNPHILIDYHPFNRPYIDYEKSTNTNYVWKKFKPNPGEIYFTKKEKVDAKKIILEAIKFWRKSNKKNYKKIIFLETSSTKINDHNLVLNIKIKIGVFKKLAKSLINKIKKRLFDNSISSQGK